MRRFALLFGLVWAVGACSASHERTCDSHDELTVCAGSTTVKGIDVSYYQGVIDWTKVKASGRAFAVARVSDGVTFQDPKFAANWDGMKKAGLIRGTYQFFRPAQDPIAQADLVVDSMEKLGREPTDLPPVIDVETADNQSATTVRTKMRAWLDRVEKRTGRKPIIYTAPFMSQTIGNGWTSYALWVAHYGVSCPSMPSDWTRWHIWQPSAMGTVPGISGPVDLDTWNGSLEELLAFAKGPPPPPLDGGSPELARPAPPATSTTPVAVAPDPCE